MGRKKNKHSRSKVSPNSDSKNVTIAENCKALSDKSENVSVDKVNTSINNCLNTEVDSRESVINQENEITFEKYQPNSERVQGREYFIHSLCQICKEDPPERVACPKCQLILYCSDVHRRKHWPVHSELCQAIVSVCEDRREGYIMQGAHNIPADKFRVYRFQTMVECENKVERPLERWEQEMFIFPNVCGKCYRHSTADFVVCDKCCHSGFCKGHQMDSHNNWCEHLLLYKSIVRNQSKFGVIRPNIPICKMPSVVPKLSTMEQVFKGIIGCVDQFEFLELTEITTYPLTALNALLMANKDQLLKLKILTLHVIGAEPEFETNNLEKWEYYLLHLIPGLESLEIEFVGPELNTTKPESYRMCSRCLAAKKSISFKFHNQLYHSMYGKPSFSKPNLICVFNPGLYRATGFNGLDSWSPTIRSMFASNCPIVSTAYTQREILLDLEKVRSMQKLHVTVEPTRNPFSSLKPSLNFVSDEDSPVIFKNHFYCVLCTAK